MVIGGRGARARGLLCGRGGRGYGRVGADVTTTVTSWASGDVAGGPTCVGEREVRRGARLAASLRLHQPLPRCAAAARLSPPEARFTLTSLTASDVSGCSFVCLLFINFVGGGGLGKVWWLRKGWR